MSQLGSIQKLNNQALPSSENLSSAEKRIPSKQKKKKILKIIKIVN